MAIFSRRILQRLIDENTSFLTKKQTRKHVNELNNGKLDFEWEIVLLNVFNKIGIEFSHYRNQNRLIVNTRIEHEPEKDDDWIVFEFGEPDVAISEFKMPDTYK